MGWAALAVLIAPARSVAARTIASRRTIRRMTPVTARGARRTSPGRNSATAVNIKHASVYSVDVRPAYSNYPINAALLRPEGTVIRSGHLQYAEENAPAAWSFSW